MFGRGVCGVDPQGRMGMFSVNMACDLVREQHPWFNFWKTSEKKVEAIAECIWHGVYFSVSIYFLLKFLCILIVLLSLLVLFLTFLLFYSRLFLFFLQLFYNFLYIHYNGVIFAEFNSSFLSHRRCRQRHRFLII